jgi:DNA-binding XRE family transcriptional regulator
MRIDKEHLKTYRKVKGWNQQQMATWLGIGFRTYQNIEKFGEVKKAELWGKINALTSQKTAYEAGNISFNEEHSPYGGEDNIERALRALSESNKLLASAHDKQAEANRQQAEANSQQAEANRVLAESNMELIKRIAIVDAKPVSMKNHSIKK